MNINEMYKEINTMKFSKDTIHKNMVRIIELRNIYSTMIDNTIDNNK